jgi:hypothetical protein
MAEETQEKHLAVCIKLYSGHAVAAHLHQAQDLLMESAGAQTYFLVVL